MNILTLVGRVANEPKIFNTSNNRKVAKITLAIKDSVVFDKVHFINCSAWGKQAETIEKHLKKGSLISCACRLVMNCYQKDDKLNYSNDIVIDSFNFLHTPAKEKSAEEICNELFNPETAKNQIIETMTMLGYQKENVEEYIRNNIDDKTLMNISSDDDFSQIISEIIKKISINV